MSEPTATFQIYFSDLSIRCQCQIIRSLRKILAEDIQDAIDNDDMERGDAQEEIVNDYINRHDGWVIEFLD